MQNIQIPAMGKQTLFSFRILGYCLLFLFLLDICTLLIPLKFTDAVWELDIYGQIIERIPLLLLSFPLIFLAEYSDRKRWENFATKIISWLTISMAIFFLLGVPLTVINTFRVRNIRHSELIVSAAKQNTPAERIADRLSKADSDNEIRSILKEINPNQIPNPQEVKKTLLTKIAESVADNQSQLEIKKQQITLSLWKNTVKWVIAGLISAAFLLYIWKQSKWARLNIGYVDQ